MSAATCASSVSSDASQVSTLAFSERLAEPISAKSSSYVEISIIGHDDFRHAAQEGEGPDMRADPIGERLRPGRLGIGVARRTRNRDKDLGWPDLASLPVLDRHGLAGIIDEEFLARPMLLPQTATRVARQAP